MIPFFRLFIHCFSYNSEEKPEAKTDMDTLYFYIADELMSPRTADN